VNGRARVAALVVGILCCAAGQLASARALSSARSDAPHESSLTASTHRQDSATVPVSALVRGGRAIGQLLSVPLAGLLAFAALLALWCTSAVRRRERLALAVITYPRRGPPSLPPVE